ncbi:hypothetical protein HY025_00990 [Candidatus Daviesbacteria bacterium]|nr:hypothetical protein [Candidatus Daviesbacteria bacterium]
MIEQPSRSFLDKSHPSLEALQPRANVEERVLTGFTPELRQQIRVGMQNYPESFRVEVKNPPSYRATVITPKFLPESALPKQGVIWLPGFTGSASDNADVAAQLYEKIPSQDKDGQLALAASLSSSIGRDLQTWRFPQSHLERATYYAAFIMQLVKQSPYPLDDLKIIAHSLAGMEAAYIIPMLRSLLRQNNSKTKIGAVVLTQPGGMYDQNRFGFVGKRTNEVTSLQGEMAEMFPSIFDIQTVKDNLENVQVQQDPARVVLLKQQLLEMEQKRQNPANLTAEQKQALAQIDEALESSDNADGGMTKSLLRHRKKLLKPVIQKVLRGADLRGKPTFKEKIQNSVNLVQFLTANFLPRRFGLTTALPEAINKGLDDVPVVLIFGEQDGYFKLKEYQEYLKKQATKGKHPLQASAKRFIAQIANWPHIAPATNPAKFASIVGDIFRRMNEPAASAITELKY